MRVKGGGWGYVLPARCLLVEHMHLLAGVALQGYLGVGGVGVGVGWGGLGVGWVGWGWGGGGGGEVGGTSLLAPSDSPPKSNTRRLVMSLTFTKSPQLSMTETF